MPTLKKVADIDEEKQTARAAPRLRKVSEPAAMPTSRVSQPQPQPQPQPASPERPRIPTAEEEALQEPWIDPTAAITGPLGFIRSLGPKAVARALPGSIASEPIIGTAQELISDRFANMPGWVKTPINLLTGLVVGDVLATGAKRASELSKIRPRPTQGLTSAERKAGSLRKAALGAAEGKEPSLQYGQAELTRKPIAQQAVEGVENLYTRYIGSPIWDKAVKQQIPKLLEKVPGGKTVNRAMIYDYRGDLPNTPEYMRMREKMERGIDLGQEYAVNLGNRLQKVPEQQQLMLGEFIRGERDDLPKNLKQLGTEAKYALYRLGKEATEVGLLDEETFFKNAGKYMPRLYTSKEYQQKLIQYGQKKPERLDLSRFHRRKDIPEEIRKQMGEILTPGYPVAKGIAQLANDVNRSKFFRGIASNPKWAVPVEVKQLRTPGGKVKRITKPVVDDVPEHFQQLPVSPKLGDLSGAYVHPEIYAELNDVAKTPSTASRVWRKALGSWKFGKVILSPKTHMRNMLSNSLLAHLGGMSMSKQPRYLSLAAKEMAKGGPFWEAAKQTGLLSSSFTSKDLRPLFDRVASQMKGTAAGSPVDTIGALGKAYNVLKQSGKKAADLYEAEEHLFKMAKFIHNVDNGMDVQTAAKDASKWLMDYGKLTRLQKKYKDSPLGAPFASFTFQAIPRVAEAAVKYPWRFITPLAIMNGISEAARVKFGETREQEEAKKKLRPDWMQGGLDISPNFLRVPITDDHGREYYLNLTYILPWGDLGEAGGFMGIPGGIRPLSQPFVSELAAQVMNYDPFFEQPIVQEEDVAGLKGAEKFKAAAGQRLGHLYRHVAPTPMIDVQKGIAAYSGEPDYRGRTRPPGVVAADVFGGLKMYPVDYAERMQQLISTHHPKQGRAARSIWNQIKQLETKKQAAKEKGKDELVAKYEEQIDKKVKQIEGLAKELGVYGQAYRTATGRAK